MNNIQLSFFTEDENSSSNDESGKRQNSLISDRVFEEFAIFNVPFFGCDFDIIYPQIYKILPSEKVKFENFDLEICIACEMISAAICHQINWDFLREAIYKKTKEDNSWVLCENLIHISENEIYQMLSKYKNKERLRISERTKILNDIGKFVANEGGYKGIFFDEQNKLLSYEKIRIKLLRCFTFSSDPNEKKLQLLLQKLSFYHNFENLNLYCQPAIDYHLIRCYLRRGLIYPKTQYAEQFIRESSVQRKESTVAALRKLCSELMFQISVFSSLEVYKINLVEWHIGRSVCLQKYPDCFLEGEESEWLKKRFVRCPFYDGCTSCHGRKDNLQLREPLYKGKSY